MKNTKNDSCLDKSAITYDGDTHRLGCEDSIGSTCSCPWYMGADNCSFLHLEYSSIGSREWKPIILRRHDRHVLFNCVQPIVDNIHHGINPPVYIRPKRQSTYIVRRYKFSVGRWSSDNIIKDCPFYLDLTYSKHPNHSHPRYSRSRDVDVCASDVGVADGCDIADDIEIQSPIHGEGVMSIKTGERGLLPVYRVRWSYDR